MIMHNYHKENFCICLETPWGHYDSSPEMTLDKKKKINKKIKKANFGRILFPHYRYTALTLKEPLGVTDHSKVLYPQNNVLETKGFITV